MVKQTILLFLGIISVGILPAQQPTPGSYRQSLNQWHWSNTDVINLDTTSVQVGKTQAQNLYPVHCQDLFLTGANLAWVNFGRDVGDGYSPDMNAFDLALSRVSNSGGNVMRWWLHTNASFSPDIDENGHVSGMAASVIPDIKAVLDKAWEHGVMLDLCLFSFDLLQGDQWMMDPVRNKKFLEDPVNIQSYIDNCLTPMVNELKGHPALFCWEIFNEPEGMTTEFGWTSGGTVDMATIQMAVNKMAGAVHATDPEARVTNGAWSFKVLTDVDQNYNYYTDDRLIAAGGDTLGYLDFYSVHYYDWAGTPLSPFHRSADYWELDKDILVAEFYVQETYGVAANDLMPNLLDNGYIGALGWDHVSHWEEIAGGIEAIVANHNEVIAFDTAGCTPACIDLELVSDTELICGQDQAQLTLTSDTVANVNFSWSLNGEIFSNDGPMTKVVDQGGEYQVRATLDGCPDAVSSVSVEQGESLTATATFCIGEAVDATVAGGTGPYYWFDSPGGGSSLAIGHEVAIVTDAELLYVRDSSSTEIVDTIGLSVNGGTLWNVDEFDVADKQTTILVQEAVRIEAVAVYASASNTNVVVRIVDAQGDPVGTGTVTALSTEKTRVELGVDLLPGYYTMDAVGTDNALKFQASGAVFPYQIDGRIQFYESESWANEWYGLFYDWEISYGGAVSVCPRMEVPVVEQEHCDGVITAVSGPDQSSAIAVFPNPFTHSTVISFPESATSATVFDAQGKTVAQLENANTATGRAWPTGLYLVRFNDGTAVRMIKR